MSRLTSLILAAAVAAACGGGTTPAPPPQPSPAPAPAPQDPCGAASVQTGFDSYASPRSGDALRNDARSEAARSRPKGEARPRVLDLLWTHEAARLRRAQQGLAVAPGAPPHGVDIGEIAVLQDQGDLVLLPNTFDLKGTGLRFTRTADGGYQVGRIDGQFRTPLGEPVRLADDDTREIELGFAVPFYTVLHRAAFLNTDGNVTFEQGDNASTDRNVSRVLGGPPRVAAFFADLDPTGGGQVFARADGEAFVVTWCGVHGFESPDTVSVQMAMLPDGTVEMRFGGDTTLTDAVVALSPGRTRAFSPVDLSAGSDSFGPAQAAGERFGDDSELDLVEVGKAFYLDHPDAHDQLVVWTDQRITTTATAFEVTVANEVRGIGAEIYDFAREFGSAGRLRSLVNMDAVTKYPDDPAQKLGGENSLLSLMGQEVGHRWLAHLRFRDHDGATSAALLGRQSAHWSFFFDSDASVMEGNDIEDLGGGSFRTVAAAQRYSLLDQYAMGLVPESAVPPFFYVENPVNIAPGSASPASAPRVGVSFSGTRRDVLIQDVIAVHGPRVPSTNESSKVHRQAFVFIVSRDRPLDPAHVTKIDRIRQAWVEFFARATDGRMRAETRLGGATSSAAR